MKRIRLEVPDHWPTDFKAYDRAFGYMVERFKITAGHLGDLNPQKFAAIIELYAGLQVPAMEAHSFQAWAALRGQTSITGLLRSALEHADPTATIEALDRAAQDKADAEESAL